MENFGKLLFFWADMAGLGKYHTGGYGRIGVYRVNFTNPKRWPYIKERHQEDYIGKLHSATPICYHLTLKCQRIVITVLNISLPYGYKGGKGAIPKDHLL